MCIGNSLKSDILPAKKIGIFAVHYLNSNTWHMDDNAEMGGFEPDAKISRHHELINLVGNWEAAY
jgi:FMN phosphatase YigB (HAD superfamily)